MTDPIWSECCSPFPPFGPKRYRPTPCSLDELPKIDIVLLSHTHYDHMDYPTIKYLGNGKVLIPIFFSNLKTLLQIETKWFVPLGLKEWFISCGITNCEELDWWEEKKFEHKGKTFQVACTPSQHWCKRTLLDDNKCLWGSWVLEGPSKRKFYFAGDTGYCSCFTEIGKEYGPIDLAAIPIGAYEPRWFMRPQHVNPEEAVKIHKDIRAQKSIGIHWGTFILTTENYLDPPKKLSEALNQENLPQEDFFVLKHGEIKLLQTISKKESDILQ